MSNSKQPFLLFLSLTLFLFSSCRKDNDDNSQEPVITSSSIYCSPYKLNDPGSGYLVILKTNGDTVLYKKTATEALNFRKWNLNGTIRYSYLEHNYQVYHIPNTGYIPGWYVLLDENFNEIKRISLLPYNGRTASDPDALDVHDFILISDNHYIAMAYYEKRVNNIPASLNPVSDCRVVACIIQEVDNGTVIWEWDGTNYPEFYTSSIEHNEFDDTSKVFDYLHVNSLFVDEKDANLICSMRNTNQVVKLHRTSGAIMWTLGGPNSDFTLAPGMKFLRQHHATLTDNGETLLLLDNGETSERAYSRVLEFSLNENTKEINSFRATPLPNGLFASFMGSVQKNGDSYFVGCGSHAVMLEFNYLTGEVLYEQSLPSGCYRTYKIEN